MGQTEDVSNQIAVRWNTRHTGGELLLHLEWQKDPIT